MLPVVRRCRARLVSNFLSGLSGETRARAYASAYCDVVRARIVLLAGPQNYRGPCPGRPRFTGPIVVKKHPMTFNYPWERSDGAKGSVHVVKVPSAGTKSITEVDSWQVGTRGERIEI